MFENVKAICQEYLKKGLPYFDLCVYKDDKELLRYMDGYADLENKLPVRGDERVNAYSNSKPVTVVAALKLWEKGLFHLEDELSAYMPEYKEMTVQTENGIVPAKNPIKIWHLFTMTAGFSYSLEGEWLEKLRQDTQGRCPTREVARYLAKAPLIYEPGTDYQYSLAHDVLAALVEVVSGKKFEAYVKENIFDPLGMTGSDFLIPMEDYETISKQYFFRKGKAELDRHNEFRFGPEHASGGAGMVSTLDDQMKFAEALRTYQLLKKETVDMLSKNWLTPRQLESFPQKEKYFYGLGVRTAKPGSARADFGWGGSAGMLLCVDIPHGISLVYAQQMRGFMNMAIRTRIYEALLQDLGFDLQIKALTREERELTY